MENYNQNEKEVEQGLVKITTYIPRADRDAIREFARDGTKAAEHYRKAIREYIRKERKNREKRG